jgi:hypothetical protein
MILRRNLNVKSNNAKEAANVSGGLMGLAASKIAVCLSPPGTGGVPAQRAG